MDRPKTYSEETQTTVPVSLIIDHPDIKYRELNEGHVNELYNSISRSGLDTPLTVWNGGSAKGREVDIPGKGKRPATFLIAGLHRRAALKRLLKDDKKRFDELFPNGVPVMVKSGEMQDFLALQLRENILRQDMSLKQIYPIMKRLRKEFDMKQKEIAKAIGKSEAYVSQVFDSADTLGDAETDEIAEEGGTVTDARKGAKKVKELIKGGKNKEAAKKEVVSSIKAKLKAKKASGRKRDDRRVSAKQLFKRYSALPKGMKTGEKIVLLENILGYLAGDENYALPEEVAQEAEESEDNEE